MARKEMKICIVTFTFALIKSLMSEFLTISEQNLTQYILSITSYGCQNLNKGAAINGGL